ncbi:Msx2-interacting protein [Geodia barretti]|uniref:Msx2-interacting protein n=1 Tax=Geodia barretti TaxID=519541 RepID=A0AA35TTY4_GEOBA|nr:Msx2-interacting protein [Geodia barretti]
MGCTMSSQGTVPLPLFGCMERAKVLQLWSSLPHFPSGGRDIQTVQAAAHKGYTPDDIDPQATHSLFVGNIPKNISVYELRDIFQRFGDVVDVEIKKMSGNATYGFVLFYDLLSAVSAKQFMDGENIHGHSIRVGFGKGTPSKMLWVDGIDADMSESVLERALGKYGKVVRLGIDRQRSSAMVQYESIDAAKEALSGVKGTFIGNSRRIMTDFANRDARAAFFARVESGDQLGPPRFPGPGMYGPGGMGPGPRGMMMPRPGVPMMGMGRGGFPPMAGPPMDMYYYNPYMGEGVGFYGGPHFPRGPPMRGMRRLHPRERGGGGLGGGTHFEESYDDYGDELRAFSRKREIEKEERKWKEHRRRHSSSDSGGSDSEGGSVSRRKKKISRDKDKSRKSKKEKDEEKRKGGGGSEVSSGDEEATRKEEARLKATQRSRDLREKLKRKNHKKVKEGSHSDSGDSGSDNEADLRKTLKKNREREKEKGKEKEKDRGGRKEPVKARDKDSGRKDEDKRSKDSKAKGSDKERDHRREKESERKAGDIKESEKQQTSGDHLRSSSRESTRKRPQTTKLRKSETPHHKMSRSNSESSKTPTSPVKAVKPSPPLTKPTKPPRTPPTPPNKSFMEEEKEDDNKRPFPETAGENMDTLPPPRSPEPEGLIREDDGTIAGPKDAPESASVPDTPESPPAPPPSNKKEQKLESDLSSGEEFTESTAGSPLSPRGPAGEEVRTEVVQPQAGNGSENEQPGKREEGGEPVRFKMKVSRLRAGVLSPTATQWSPDHHHSPPHTSPPPSKTQTRHSPPPAAPSNTTSDNASTTASSRISGMEELDDSRKSRKLPRCYQLEDERLREKQREPKEHRHTKQHPRPTTPSPPPSYAASSSTAQSSHRRRHAHSPPPPQQQQAEYGRWRQRGSRHFSPTPQFGSRRYSRSPPPPFGYPKSPPPPSHGGGGRSPYSSSPPRPRTPIQRPLRDRGPGGSRHRYDSPPYDMPPRGKHGRHGSSPVRHFSPSPPLLLSSRPRSPGGPSGRRHYQRRYSRSPSLPPVRRSPLRRKDPPRSPSPGSSRSSPHYPEDRLEPRKFTKKPSHVVYSRSPSPPKSKRREGGLPREEYPDSKRRRVEDSRGVKSPTTMPGPVKDESTKGSRPVKSQPPLYAASSSDRHHGSGKEPQQAWYKSETGEGGVAQGGGTPRSSHHTASHGKMTSSPPSKVAASSVPSKPVQQPQPPADNLLDLLRRYPVMWQGHLTLKNESAAVQLHFLSGNAQLAKSSLPGLGEGQSPALRIAQRMRLEQTQLEGVQRRMQNESEHCLLLALPCGRDAGDVRAQTHALKNSLISYLLQKQAAGIINVPGSQVNANSCSVQCFLHYCDNACEMITHSDNLQGSLPWGVGQGFRRV